MADLTKSVTAQAREAAHDAYFRHAENASTLAAGKAADAAVRVVLEHLAADCRYQLDRLIGSHNDYADGQAAAWADVADLIFEMKKELGDA